jgi:hypothetical protein
LPEQHEEWSQFRFPEAMQVKLGFECLPGYEELVYELEYKEKRDSQNVVKKDLKGKLAEIDWNQNSILAKATLKQPSNLKLNQLLNDQAKVQDISLRMDLNL